MKLHSLGVACLVAMAAAKAVPNLKPKLVDRNALPDRNITERATNADGSVTCPGGGTFSVATVQAAFDAHLNALQTDANIGWTSSKGKENFFPHVFNNGEGFTVNGAPDPCNNPQNQLTEWPIFPNGQAFTGGTAAIQNPGLYRTIMADDGGSCSFVQCYVLQHTTGGSFTQCTFG